MDKQNVVYYHYYPVCKRNEVLTHTATWTNLENLMLSESIFCWVFQSMNIRMLFLLSMFCSFQCVSPIYTCFVNLLPKMKAYAYFILLTTVYNSTVLKFQFPIVHCQYMVDFCVLTLYFVALLNSCFYSMKFLK